MLQVVLDPMLHQPPRRVRDDELGHPVEELRLFGRIRQRARGVVQPIELGQMESRVVLLADIRPVQKLHEVLGVRIVGVPR